MSPTLAAIRHWCQWQMGLEVGAAASGWLAQDRGTCGHAGAADGWWLEALLSWAKCVSRNCAGIRHTVGLGDLAPSRPQGKPDWQACCRTSHGFGDTQWS